MRRPASVLLLVSLAPVVALATQGGCSSAYVALPQHDAGGSDAAARVDGGSSGDDGGGGAEGGSGDAGSEAAVDASGGDGAAPRDAGGQDATPDAPGDAGTDGGASSEGGATGPDVWVVRVGAAGASSALDGTAAATFIDRFSIADGTPRGMIALPVAAAGSNQPLTTSGSATSEGGLSRSADGKSVVLAGYAAAPGAGDVHADGAVTAIKDAPTTGAGAVLRVVGRVDASGHVDTSLTTTAYSGNSIRGVVTVDGSAFWLFGDGSGSSGGVTYQATGGGSPAFVSTGAASVRAGEIFGGRLYGSASTGAFRGVFTMVSALPTSAEAAAMLPGFPTTAGPSSYGFAGLALGATTAVDTFYVCDDSSSAAGGGVQRWKLAGGTWTLATTFNDSMTSGCRGLAASVSGTQVTLLVSTTETTGNRLLELVDTTAGLTTTTATKLADAPANTVFRGVALGPN